ncbi:hypothetical protein [Gimesia sp.]|uniref:hypothetical protein n=1 Tax=Gimesia sp. TaxID=2024833 RepID=UPI003A92FA48
MQQHKSLQNLMTVGLLLLAGASAVAAEPAPEEDYQALEGKWMRSIHDSKLGPLRVENEMKSNISNIRIYDRSGNITYFHRVKYRLQRVEDMKLLVYYDLEVLEGPKKGLKQNTLQPCIYRLRGDQLVVAEGMIEGDKFPSLILVWWKVKPAEPEPGI